MNLLLAIGAAAGISQTGISGAGEAIAYSVFAAVGTLGVAAPVAVHISLGNRSQRPLGALKDWMTRYNAVIMSVFCLILAVWLFWHTISVLT